jgi:hypothetical protein
MSTLILSLPTAAWHRVYDYLRCWDLSGLDMAMCSGREQFLLTLENYGQYLEDGPNPSWREVVNLIGGPSYLQWLSSRHINLRRLHVRIDVSNWIHEYLNAFTSVVDLQLATPFALKSILERTGQSLQRLEVSYVTSCDTIEMIRDKCPNLKSLTLIAYGDKVNFERTTLDWVASEHPALEEIDYSGPPSTFALIHDIASQCASSLNSFAISSGNKDVWPTNFEIPAAVRPKSLSFKSLDESVLEYALTNTVGATSLQITTVFTDRPLSMPWVTELLKRLKENSPDLQSIVLQEIWPGGISDYTCHNSNYILSLCERRDYVGMNNTLIMGIAEWFPTLKSFVANGLDITEIALNALMHRFRFRSLQVFRILGYSCKRYVSGVKVVFLGAYVYRLQGVSQLDECVLSSTA